MRQVISSVSQIRRNMKNTGESYPLDSDAKILKINSPKESVEGPYAVVFKSIEEERWAIIAFDWDGNPRLGIRWFHGNIGHPFSSGHGTWLVIPPLLSKSILSGLPLDRVFAGQLDAFLCGIISGKELSEWR